MNKWDAKFGFFWYNDDELFKFTQEDFDRKAKKISESGINIVMTFSCTHFRWSFYPYWDRILRCIRMTVKACHKYGIKVVEHSSSHLTFNPINQEQLEYVKSVFKARKGDISSWDGFIEYMDEDFDIDGKPISSFRQIDGRTGDYARSNYNGYCMCFNNPHYEKAYFNYLEKVYATKVDGIMTDDVQFFGQGHACACKYCKQKFKKQTGFDMPKPGKEWESFYGDYDNPVYVAWERFRKRSTEQFQRRVNDHFKNLGLSLLRPNYVSGAINSNPTGYCFQYGADLWDWIFQENCLAHLIRLSWPHWQVESMHRYALAQRNDVPSMSLFYPDREDSYYFVWALAHSWGQMLTVTTDGDDLSDIEKKYRAFEEEYANILNNQKKLARIGILFSVDTAYYTENKKHTHDIFSWGQGLYFSNYASDMLFADDIQEKFNEYELIILPNVTMLNDSQLKKLHSFVNNGGKLLITGIPGLKDNKGKQRNLNEITKALGLNKKPSPTNSKKDTSIRFSINKDIVFDNQDMEYIFKTQENAIAYSNDNVVGVKEKVGNGFIYWIPSGLNLKSYGVSGINKRKNPHGKNLSQAPVTNFLKRKIGGIIKSIYNEERFVYENIPGDWIITAFHTSDRKSLVFHVIDTKGIIPEKPEKIGHDDIIPSFSNNYKPDYQGHAKFSFEKNTNLSKATLITPENENPVTLELQQKDDSYEFSIPKGAFRSYAIIICQ